MWLFAVLHIDKISSNRFVPCKPTDPEEIRIVQCWDILAELFPDSYQSDNLFPW